MSAFVYLIRPIVHCAIDHQYIGSTERTLNRRFACHKYDLKCSSKTLFELYGADRLEIIELEKCEPDVRRIREEHWRRIVPNVNKCRAVLTREEMLEDKRKYNQEYHEERLEYDRKYRQAHREEINERRSKKTDCECGGRYTLRGKSRHVKTAKHRDYCSSINDSIAGGASH